MAVRSTTARRLATVIVATAAVSAMGTGAASAATNPAPAGSNASTSAPATGGTVPPLSLPQVGVLLHNLLGTVDGVLGDSLGVRTEEEVAANADKPLLAKTVDNLTKTTKEVPLLGGAVGGVTDNLGLSEPAKVGSKPQPAPQTVVPPKTPVKAPPKTDRVDSIADPGSTWTAPMEQTPVAPAPVVRETEKPAPGGLPGLITDIRSILPSNAAEAAAAGAGAATIALIVLGGIAVTGAAGAASTAGRRGLINGSVGGSL